MESNAYRMSDAFLKNLEPSQASLKTYNTDQHPHFIADWTDVKIG